MDNSLTFKDIKLLLKEKTRMIVIMTLLGAVMFSGFKIASNFIDDEAAPDEVVEDTTYDFDTLIETEQEMLNDDEIDFIEETLLEDAYSFRIYIENQDGSLFNRNNLMKEILTAPSTVESIGEETSVELAPYEDYFLNIDLNTDNVVYTITVGLGNENASQAVSNAYYEAFQNKEIEIIDNKIIKLFESPKPVTEEQEDEARPVVNEESSLSDILLSALIGTFLGFCLGVVLTFISTLFDKRISPIYNYQLQDNDVFVNFSYLKLDDTERLKALKQVIQYPSNSKKLIVSNDLRLIDKLKENLDDNLAFPPVIKADVYDIDPSYKFDEVIIITENQKTEKEWYTKVRNQIQIYKKPLQIVKFK
ncbi:MAG: hypothetical protein L0J63_13305 [Tetragenococcus koreensis]|nr:hypothetical protein [Tetragenococcus koreensis]